MKTIKRSKLAALICFVLLHATNINMLAAENYAPGVGHSASGKRYVPWVGNTLSGAPCKGLDQGYGPFDYTMRFSIPREHLDKVEGAHFTSEVQNFLIGSFAGDLDYTLRAWPNHHKALASITRYHFMRKHSSEKRYRRKTLPSPVECYFQRAINFSPKDAVAHLLYGIFLHKSGHTKEGRKIYEKALVVAPENRSIHYNYGLLLVSMKRYNEAKIHALKAYNAGYPLPGLKRQLAKVGHWE